MGSNNVGKKVCSQREGGVGAAASGGDLWKRECMGANGISV